jgi:hypothetical protein
MDIRSHILATRVARHGARITSLEGLNAPAIVIDQERALLARAQAGDLGKLATGKGEEAAALLAREYTSAEWGTGRGGKPFLTFATVGGSVRYFPAAKYGPFISALNKDAE